MDRILTILGKDISTSLIVTNTNVTNFYMSLLIPKITKRKFRLIKFMYKLNILVWGWIKVLFNRKNITLKLNTISKIFKYQSHTFLQFIILPAQSILKKNHKYFHLDHKLKTKIIIFYPLPTSHHQTKIIIVLY